MAGSVNKVILVGNLGKDPEMRSLNNGDRIANLRIATSESWKDRNSGERKEKTEWHSVVVFNEGMAKFAESYLRKGSKVYIEGQLQTRKWTDQNGQEKWTTEIVIRPFNGVLTSLDGKREGGGDRGGGGGDDYGFSAESPRQDARGNPREPSFDLDDEIPFVSRGGLW
jgi:single-strand DNA-binding protein